MATLNVTEKQLRLIQYALDFYSRVGIGQLDVILDHPTFQKELTNKLRPNRELVIGDDTERGKVTEIGKGYIKTIAWGDKEEKIWKDIKNVKLSIDYNTYHEIREKGREQLLIARNILLQEQLPENSSYGIYSGCVDESCREAYDLVQVIRHEFWKKDDNRNDSLVSKYVNLSTQDSDKISVLLE